MTGLGATLILAGVAIGVAALVALHVLPTGLSPLRNPVSQYGISKYRVGYRVQTIAFGIAGVGAAIGLSSLHGSVAPLIGFCVVFALARLAISWFPMDQPGTERTATGRRHGLLAICAFGAIGIAAEELHKVLVSDRIDLAYATSSRVLALLMVASFVGMGVARRSGSGFFGLAERAFYLCMTAWLVLVAVLLLMHPS
jgi:hypothetical protein